MYASTVCSRSYTLLGFKTCILVSYPQAPSQTENISESTGRHVKAGTTRSDTLQLGYCKGNDQGCLTS